jgi:hypothetical protein
LLYLRTYTDSVVPPPAAAAAATTATATAAATAAAATAAAAALGWIQSISSATVDFILHVVL